MSGTTLVGIIGIINSADGPTSILTSGNLPAGYIVATVAAIILAVILILRARQSDSVEPMQAVAIDGSVRTLEVAEDEQGLAVAIATAILMMETSVGGQHLVIRSIRYVGTEGSPWAAAGRKDLMNQRNGRNHS